jgi:predicted MFS family arabinose efflux permease
MTNARTAAMSTDSSGANGRKTLALFLVGFCAFLALYATQPLLPLFHRSFNASKLMVSLTVSAATLAVALAAPFVGIIADLRGRKKVIIPAIYALAVVNLLTATAPGLKTLIFGRFAQGLLTPAVFAVAVAYINEEWDACAAGYVTSVYVTGTVVGGFCGRFISGFVAARWSWPWVFVCIGALNLGLAFLISAWLPPARQFKKEAGFHAGLRNMRAHLHNRALLGIYAVGFTILLSLVGTFTYITFYLAEPPFNLGPATLGGIFSVYLVGALVTPLAGRWSNRVPGWKMLTGALLFSMCGVLLTLSHGLPLVIAGITMCSSGVFVCQIVTNRSIGPAAGRARAAAVGLYVTFYYCGGFVGSVAPGFLWELGGWPYCAAFLAAVLLLAALFTLRVWPGLETKHGSRTCDALEVVN